MKEFWLISEIMALIYLILNNWISQMVTSFSWKNILIPTIFHSSWSQITASHIFYIFNTPKSHKVTLYLPHNRENVNNHLIIIYHFICKAINKLASTMKMHGSLSGSCPWFSPLIVKGTVYNVLYFVNLLCKKICKLHYKNPINVTKLCWQISMSNICE